jgi:uncharacterized protein (TIGR04255 family)
MSNLPVELAKDTIVECVFEARFGPGAPSAAELLPGVIFGRLRKFFKSHLSLPLGQIPAEIRLQSAFNYVPTHAIEGPNIRMLFGPQVAAVSFPKPYSGWDKVRPKIVECMNAIFDSELMGRPERFSVKYVNLLQEGIDEFDIEQTNLKFSLGRLRIRRPGLAVKAEMELNGCDVIVEIATGANIVLPGFPQQSGVLMAVDAIKQCNNVDCKASLPETLEALHNTEKEVFFDLLTPQTLEKLRPRYATKK